MANTIKILFESIVTLYDALASAYSTQYGGFCSRVLIDFERGRFLTWGEVLGLTRNDLMDGNIDSQSEANLDSCQGQMLNIQNALHGAIKVYEEKINSGQVSAICSYESNISKVRELHRSLQAWNDKLQSLLPPMHSSRMEELWPRRNNLPDNPNQLSIVETTSALPPHTVIRPKFTAATRYLGQLMKQRRCDNGKRLFVENSVDIGANFGEHSLGWFNAKDSTSKSLLLVEWKYYNNDWTSATGQELYDRVGALAELLHQPEKHGRNWLRVLNCVGWLHDEQACRFGFVYEIIDEPISLYNVIERSKSQKKGRPPLGMKFQLATMIARCLLDVHDIGWLHKNISAHNIIFSPSHGAMITTASLYMIGFHHSRIDDEKAFTEGPNIDNKQIEYQHPEYRSSAKKVQERFHRVYDYYSLGLVLLEIGFWVPFNNIADGKRNLSPFELRQYLINELAPRLDERMGIVYRDAVVACLNGDFGNRYREDIAQAHKETRAAFESKVVNPLSSCFA